MILSLLAVCVVPSLFSLGYLPRVPRSTCNLHFCQWIHLRQLERQITCIIWAIMIYHCHVSVKNACALTECGNYALAFNVNKKGCMYLSTIAFNVRHLVLNYMCSLIEMMLGYFAPILFYFFFRTGFVCSYSFLSRAILSILGNWYSNAANG